MPQFINLDQGSPDWLLWREKGLGASDCPIVMEESPWTTAYQLWMLKTGLAKAKPPSAAMEHGKVSEEPARQWYMEKKNLQVLPCAAVYDDAEFIRASVDGWHTGSKHGVEIKCPTSIEGHRKAKEGQIPWMYMLQMYQEMEVLDAASWDYCSWFAGDGVIIPVTRDQELWALQILPRLQEFWRRVEEKSWPVPEGNAVNDSPEWAENARALAIAKAKVRTWEDIEAGAKAYFRREATAKVTVGGGVRVVWTPRKASRQVVINAESAEALKQILAAIEPLKGKKGVGEITTKDVAANIALYVFETE